MVFSVTFTVFATPNCAFVQIVKMDILYLDN